MCLSSREPLLLTHSVKLANFKLGLGADSDGDAAERCKGKCKELL
jgi:hypothetical protein